VEVEAVSGSPSYLLDLRYDRLIILIQPPYPLFLPDLVVPQLDRHWSDRRRSCRRSGRSGSHRSVDLVLVEEEEKERGRGV